LRGDDGVASLFGVTCGLLAFAAMIVRGLLVGNTPEVILLRSLGGLFGFLVVGTIAGWVASRILEDRPDVASSDMDVSSPASTRNAAKSS
jgi:hypothetical protein